MTLKKRIPTLMVKDVSRTIEFYETLFGFKRVGVIPDIEPFEWVSMKCGEVEIAFQEEANMRWDIPEMRGAAIGRSFTFSVQIKGLDSL